MLVLRDVLRRNGSAVDAAVAVLACNGVVHPQSMGLGGGFVMTVYVAKERKAYTLMARETAPRAVHRDMFVNNTNAAQYGKRLRA